MRRSLILTASLVLLGAIPLATAEPAAVAAQPAAEAGSPQSYLGGQQCRADEALSADSEAVAEASLCELVCAVAKAKCDLGCGGDSTCLLICELNDQACLIRCLLKG